MLEREGWGDVLVGGGGGGEEQVAQVEFGLTGLGAREISCKCTYFSWSCFELLTICACVIFSAGVCVNTRLECRQEKDGEDESRVVK